MSEQAPHDDHGTDARPGRWTPPRELLSIELERSSQGVTAVARGELDESTAPQLIDRLEREAGADVVLDLGGLTFCGSAGLSAFIVLDGSLRGSGGSLAIANPTVFVVELLELAGIDELIVADPAAD